MKKKHFNLHTHCHYCDGSSEPEEYIREAIRLGFGTLGFSSHAPVPFENRFAIQSEDQLKKYAYEIRFLKQKYAGKIEILLGLEADFIPGITRDFGYLKEFAGLDYIIGGIHLIKNPEKENLWFTDGPKQESYDQGLQAIFDNDIKLAVKTYWQQVRLMIETQKPDIIAHLDKIKMHNKNRFFTEDEAWYQEELDATLDLIARSGQVVEVNTRGIYKGRSDELFPGIDALKKIRSLHIPITLSSDAHKSEELNLYFEETKEILRKTGFEKLRLLTGKGWEEVDL
jgi:histidinol-phosphatase (PHP family)